MNTELLAWQTQWDEKCIMQYTKMSQKSISRPFAYGVSEEYITAGFKLMVIGQEAAGFSVYDDPRAWGLARTQQWVVDYTRRQLWKICAGDAHNKRPNCSPFWNFMRNCNNLGLTPSWNNIDKVYQKKTVDTDEKVIRLTDDQRREFNKAVCTGKTLLQREIEISKPDGIVFVTGPYYQVSMETALGLPEGSLTSKKPEETAHLKNISSEVDLGIPCLWTYHPAYLCRMHMNLKDCVKEIVNVIKQHTR